MVASNTTGVRHEELAHQVFSLITKFCLRLPRGRRNADLKEVEFLTLTILQANGTMIVGDIQRLLGVLPAQMSRIIRSLEARERPFIICQINPNDKRKIDVCLTSSGEKALWDYQTLRIHGIAELLRKLSEEDFADLSRLIEKFHGHADRVPRN